MSWLNLTDLAVALLYLASFLLFLLGIFRDRVSLKKAATWMIACGFLLHTASLGIKTASAPQEAITQGQFYFSLLAWSLLLIYLLVWRLLRASFLALTAAPLALILFTPSMLIYTQPLSVPSQWSPLWFGLHICALFFSLAFLAIGFGASLFYLYMNRKLKNKERRGAFRRDVPSLSTFDRINHLTVVVGFPLFTLGLVSGFIWAGLTWGDIFTWDPKELLSIFIWLLFAYLFHQRMALGWKGRKPAHLASWIFALSLISLVVVNFFFPTHHSF